jgi:hypothetical protein
VKVPVTAGGHGTGWVLDCTCQRPKGDVMTYHLILPTNKSREVVVQVDPTSIPGITTRVFLTEEEAGCSSLVEFSR